MGLEGDQSIDYMQNKTLNESPSNGVTPFLFEVYETGKYLFRGKVELAEQPFEEIQPDKNDAKRTVWIFPLKIAGPDSEFKVPEDMIEKKQQQKERQAKRLNDSELFARAIHSQKKLSNRQVVSTTIERNEYVSEFIKRRANGRCQLCNQQAPFKNKKNEPYLESHHIIWLSQGGEDTIENSVALCPNCHRKMHILNLEGDREKLEQEALNSC
jgi:5-methylcytosine-specific restriction protein A